MTKIAQSLGVSRTTVSYVLNDPQTDLVGGAMRMRVLERAHEMGYRPNRAAQTVAGRPSHLIELFVEGYYPAYYARALHEFERQAWPTPYQLYIVHPNRWPEDYWENYHSEWPTDGVIIFDEALPEKAIASIKGQGKPVVALGLCPPTDIDHVHVDVRPALFEAIRHLAASKGRVACLMPLPLEIKYKLTELRYLIYQQVMQEANLEEEIIIAPDGTGSETRILTRTILRDYIKEHGCPEAIFCFNDERAIATMAALRDLHYRVPEDVLIVGHDGIEEADYQTPPLSTIQFPIEEGARLAWDMLQHRIRYPNAPVQSATLAAPFLLRESSFREIYPRLNLR